MSLVFSLQDCKKGVTMCGIAGEFQFNKKIFLFLTWKKLYANNFIEDLMMDRFTLQKVWH